MTAGAGPDDALSWPIDFGARYATGVDRGLCLGGGGLYFIAWLTGYLNAAAKAGMDLQAAERMVGTSAGSVVATLLAGGRLGRLHAQVSALSRFPAVLSALAPTSSLTPSQQRALDLFRYAVDAQPATIRAIGHAALAAQTPEAARMRGNLHMVLQTSTWPSEGLHVTAVDAYTGERCVITAGAGIRPARVAAASSAVPGLFPPQRVGDRRCMDGGVSGTGLHLDLLAGAQRVLVLSLTGSAAAPAGMTQRSGATAAEVSALQSTGTQVLLRGPGEVDVASLMAPEAVPDALAVGAAQAEQDADLLTEFWA